MAQQPRLSFNDGRSIPQVGLGVWRTPRRDAVDVVRTAIESGYRHIDTATIYENETEVGDGIRASDVPRGDIFVTTKLWNDDQGHDAALRAFDASLSRLGLEYLDLYLIHWPSPRRKRYRETWKALVQLRNDGRVRSIGVSNFAAEHLHRIIDDTGVVPALNQIELHPRFQQRALRDTHAALGIRTESWSPLGQGKLLADATIARIAEKYGRTPAQIIIRWHIDNGLVVIPKSVTPDRIRENLDVFDFSLDDADLQAIGALDASDGRIGSDPNTALF